MADLHGFNACPEELEVGDFVVTDFNERGSPLVLKIVEIESHSDFASGLRVTTRQETCSSCGKVTSRPIVADGSWFIPVEEER